MGPCDTCFSDLLYECLVASLIYVAASTSEKLDDDGTQEAGNGGSVPVGGSVRL